MIKRGLPCFIVYFSSCACCCGCASVVFSVIRFLGNFPSGNESFSWPTVFYSTFGLFHLQLRLAPRLLQHRFLDKFRSGNESFSRPTVFYNTFGRFHLQLRLAPRLLQHRFLGKFPSGNESFSQPTVFYNHFGLRECDRRVSDVRGREECCLSVVSVWYSDVGTSESR